MTDKKDNVPPPVEPDPSIQGDDNGPIGSRTRSRAKKRQRFKPPPGEQPQQQEQEEEYEENEDERAYSRCVEELKRSAQRVTFLEATIKRLKEDLKDAYEKGGGPEGTKQLILARAEIDRVRGEYEAKAKQIDDLKKESDRRLDEWQQRYNTAEQEVEKCNEFLEQARALLAKGNEKYKKSLRDLQEEQKAKEAAQEESTKLNALVTQLRGELVRVNNYYASAQPQLEELPKLKEQLAKMREELAEAARKEAKLQEERLNEHKQHNLSVQAFNQELQALREKNASLEREVASLKDGPSLGAVVKYDQAKVDQQIAAVVDRERQAAKQAISQNQQAHDTQLVLRDNAATQQRLANLQSIASVVGEYPTPVVADATAWSNLAAEIGRRLAVGQQAANDLRLLQQARASDFTVVVNALPATDPRPRDWPALAAVIEAKLAQAVKDSTAVVHYTGEIKDSSEKLRECQQKEAKLAAELAIAKGDREANLRQIGELQAEVAAASRDRDLAQQQLAETRQAAVGSDEQKALVLRASEEEKRQLSAKIEQLRSAVIPAEHVSVFLEMELLAAAGLANEPQQRFSPKTEGGRLTISSWTELVVNLRRFLHRDLLPALADPRLAVLNCLQTESPMRGSLPLFQQMCADRLWAKALSELMGKHYTPELSILPQAWFYFTDPEQRQLTPELANSIERCFGAFQSIHSSLPIPQDDKTKAILARMKSLFKIASEELAVGRLKEFAFNFIDNHVTDNKVGPFKAADPVPSVEQITAKLDSLQLTFRGRLQMRKSSAVAWSLRPSVHSQQGRKNAPRRTR